MSAYIASITVKPENDSANHNSWINHGFTSDQQNVQRNNCKDSLCQHLDLEVLIDSFAESLHHCFAISRVDFTSQELEVDLEIELSKQICWLQQHCHQTSYHLEHDGKSLGTLTLYRVSKFSISEKYSIDKHIDDLYVPLNNAIRYAHACRFGYRDALTGLNNRAALESFVFNKAPSDQAITTVLVCDLDRFKSINDHHGHIFGDEMIKKFAEKITSVIGNKGKVYRYGGDEFVIALDSVSPKASVQIAEKLRVKTALTLQHNNTPLTTTIGATAVRHGECLRDTFSRADEALLKGKNTGSNTVVWSP